MWVYDISAELGLKSTVISIASLVCYVCDAFNVSAICNVSPDMSVWCVPRSGTHHFNRFWNEKPTIYEAYQFVYCQFNIIKLQF